MSLRVPYSQNVNLPVGSSVTIKGRADNIFRCVLYNAGAQVEETVKALEPQLQVDFHTGRDPRSDIAFSFRVYFGKCVVMNSFLDGAWGEEIRSSKLPFEESKPFKLCFMVQAKEYKVMVNDEHFYSFPHRVNASSVQMVEVWRDILLSSVDI